MQFSFVYADLQLEVFFQVKDASPFCELTDVETMTLQQIIYMALIDFQYIRALHAKDIDALQKVIESIKKNTDIL